MALPTTFTGSISILTAESKPKSVKSILVTWEVNVRKSGYKSIFHTYRVFLIILCIMIFTAIGFIFRVFTIQRPDGRSDLSNWPINFTQSFSEQIMFDEDGPFITQTGLEALQKNNLWIQIIDQNGNEVLSCRKPEEVLENYTSSQLLELYKKGSKGGYSLFFGQIQNKSEEWTYIIGFPVKISKLTTYINADRFSQGKNFFLGLVGILIFVVLLSGAFYGLWISRQLSRVIASVGEIASRTYNPVKPKGLYFDVYESLNKLDEEIKASDQERLRNEKHREEWIANITHDLKTPLSPIKGYAELLADPEYPVSDEDKIKYGSIILKNSIYAEELVNDLKLSYQLKNEMLLLNKTENDMVRFIKEIVIDILNNPDYQSRNINFASENKSIVFYFDTSLMKRAINNLIYNSLVHNYADTIINVSVYTTDRLEIHIEDNGRGMSEEEVRNLFSRYFRGTSTKEKPEGTGLGMAIAKQIIELHEGEIFVKSRPGIGTSFLVSFPI